MSRRRTAALPFTFTLALALVAGLAVPAHADPGKLDTFFSGDGKATAFANGATGYAVAIDAKGRIVVAGSTQTAKPDFAVARFLPNGAPDTEFSKDGRVTVDLGGADYGFDLALQSDGKIVVAGERDTKTQNTFALVRLLPKGGLDKDFGGGDGIVLTDFGKRYQGANAVVVYPNGNIAAGGFASNGSTGRWAIARYGPKGVLDKSWGKDGRVTVDLSSSDESIRDLLFVPGGKLVGVGYAESGLIPRFAVARFRPKGTLDPEFGNKGFNLTDVSKGSDIGYGAALQSDGKIVVVGYANNSGKADWGLVRYGAKGRLDKTFGGDGKVVTKMTTEYEFAAAVAVQANGRLVVVGRASREGTADNFGVFRYKPGGALDQSWSGNGKTFTDFGSGNDTARDVAIQENGKIVVAGDGQVEGTHRFTVARYLDN
jgi:uncharacterized delta-60 repeat protein